MLLFPSLPSKLFDFDKDHQADAYYTDSDSDQDENAYERPSRRGSSSVVTHFDTRGNSYKRLQSQPSSTIDQAFIVHQPHPNVQIMAKATRKTATKTKSTTSKVPPKQHNTRKSNSKAQEDAVAAVREVREDQENGSDAQDTASDATDHGSDTEDANETPEAKETPMSKRRRTIAKKKKQQDKYDTMLALVQAKDAKIKELEDLAKKNGRKKITEPTKPVAKAIRDFISWILFRKMKFILNEADEEAVCEMFLDQYDTKSKLWQGDSDEVQARREEFIETYAPYVTSCHNSHRQKVMSAIGKEYKKYLEENNGERPDLDKIRSFVVRDFHQDAWNAEGSPNFDEADLKLRLKSAFRPRAGKKNEGPKIRHPTARICQKIDVRPFFITLGYI